MVIDEIRVFLESLPHSLDPVILADLAYRPTQPIQSQIGAAIFRVRIGIIVICVQCSIYFTCTTFVYIHPPIFASQIYCIYGLHMLIHTYL